MWLIQSLITCCLLRSQWKRRQLLQMRKRGNGECVKKLIKSDMICYWTQANKIHGFPLIRMKIAHSQTMHTHTHMRRIRCTNYRVDREPSRYEYVHSIWFYGCQSWFGLVAREIGIQWTVLFNVNTFSVFQSNATGSVQFAYNKNHTHLHTRHPALVLAFARSVLLIEKDWFFGFKA